jgi:hypothetical protein
VACVVPPVVLTVVPLFELLLLVAVVVPVVVPVVPEVLVDVVVVDAALLQAVSATVPASEAATSTIVVARTLRSPISRRLRVGAVVLGADVVVMHPGSPPRLSWRCRDSVENL